MCARAVTLFSFLQTNENFRQKVKITCNWSKINPERLKSAALLSSFGHYYSGMVNIWNHCEFEPSKLYDLSFWNRIAKSTVTRKRKWGICEKWRSSKFLFVCWHMQSISPSKLIWQGESPHIKCFFIIFLPKATSNDSINAISL